MFTVELYARIRRAVMVNGLSRREAARRFGVHRNTISKMLLYSVPPGSQRAVRQSTRASRSFSPNPTGTLSRRQLAQFVSAVDFIDSTNTANGSSSRSSPRPRPIGQPN